MESGRITGSLLEVQTRDLIIRVLQIPIAAYFRTVTIIEAAAGRPILPRLLTDRPGHINLLVHLPQGVAEEVQEVVAAVVREAGLPEVTKCFINE